MSLAIFQEQIESEREWREAEIRFLNNMQGGLSDKDRTKIRRSIVCLLYAHIEGFVRFAFSLYVDQVNRKGLTCKDVSPAIAAAAFAKELKALKDINSKSPFFIKALPDDKHLHGFARDVDFITQIGNFYDHPVVIAEGYVNTENNVGREVLEKMLFQVGLEYSDLKDAYSPLNRLLNVRNDIAHGKRKQGISDEDYNTFLNCCRSVMTTISRRLTSSFGAQKYLK
ncbi:MAE_28990/MAE_18760 family HEPN-like nuclease [Pseudomonas sp. Leaf59]|uniref:MAE_28990/MAE_18760 family HEPN-like nuclease n=1 Tax=Pseudomonas sp. Leaf59 TaxID=2876556 RepID=UPI001E48E085|nr:MAE_28990/MAE_18760 family HEPN-like nuclease [Pseudomonas sp. Leaf59]